MSTALHEVQSRSVVEPLLKVMCEDGKEYSARPYQWTVESVEEYSKKLERTGIFSDDMSRTFEGFIANLTTSIWFELLNDQAENIGFVYLSNMVKSATVNRFISATWHAVVWDSKAAPRRALAKAVIQLVFRMFKLHRLVVEIPLQFGGAIRTCKKLGFKEEGILREARRYNGVWFGVLAMSILESEV